MKVGRKVGVLRDPLVFDLWCFFVFFVCGCFSLLAKATVSPMGCNACGNAVRCHGEDSPRAGTCYLLSGGLSCSLLKLDGFVCRVASLRHCRLRATADSPCALIKGAVATAQARRGAAKVVRTKRAIYALRLRGVRNASHILAPPGGSHSPHRTVRCQESHLQNILTTLCHSKKGQHNTRRNYTDGRQQAPKQMQLNSIS